jgi:hypothetical protein
VVLIVNPIPVDQRGIDAEVAVANGFGCVWQVDDHDLDAMRLALVLAAPQFRTECVPTDNPCQTSPPYRHRLCNDLVAKANA